ncbi:MAG: hypothetical protein IT385_31130 [Deltaproteobacteria bacterium]|nr:hypothetical protein [Deltaproteobacteria bacterium]
MVLASFIISTAVVLLALGAIQAGRRAAHERDRRTLEDEVASFLDHARVPDPEHAEGSWRGMPLHLVLGHDEITYDVKLTPAVIPYKELLAKFGSPDLVHELEVMGMTLGDDDVLRGRVPREVGLGENLVTIENRLPLALRVLDLRKHAPGELVERIERARASRDIDAILIALAQHFPDSPEMEEAIERAAEREHAHPDRVRERAQGWLARHDARA